MTYPDDYKVNIDDFPINENGHHIVPDEIMEKFYRQLPSGTVNQSGTFKAFNGGRLHLLGNDKEWTKEVTTAGANALNAVKSQRRTLAEDMRDLLGRAADDKTLQAAGLDKGTYQDAIIAALIRESVKGNVRAFDSFRDTIGEAPVKQAEITAAVTEGDKELLRKVQQRLGIE